MKLTVQHQQNATSFTCQLQPPGGTIGRGEQNDLNLTDTSGELSSLQAILRVDEARAGATILNMSSMGRVSVNDTPLGLSQETAVKDGDRICIGDYLITVENPAAAPASPGAPTATVTTATSAGSTASAGAAAGSHALPASAGLAATAGAATQSHADPATAGFAETAASVSPTVPAGGSASSSSTDSSGSALAMDESALSATPYDTAAFTGDAAAAPGLAAASPPADFDKTVASANTEDPAQLPTWHPAYQPPGQSAISPSGSQDHPLGLSSANDSTTPATHAGSASDTMPQSDPYPDEHPLGTPINRMPPPVAVPNTTVAPMPGSVPASQPAHEALTSSAPEQSPPTAPPPEENPDDIFKDLLSGPGVLPVGGTSMDERHPFEMESATNRNHHNPVELLRPEGLHHPSIDGDPLDSLPSDGAEKDRQTIFSDDSPTTLNKDTALDGHKEDNILETLRRAAHSGYKDRDQDPDKGDR